MKTEEPLLRIYKNEFKQVFLDYFRARYLKHKDNEAEHPPSRSLRGRHRYPITGKQGRYKITSGHWGNSGQGKALDGRGARERAVVQEKDSPEK